MKEKITKGEIFLLGLTAVFMAGLLCLSHQDRQAGITVDTEIAVPQEQILPDHLPLDLNSATAEELAQLPPVAIRCQKHNPYGVEALVHRSAVPAGVAVSPVSMEELFVFMAKEAR